VTLMGPVTPDDAAPSVLIRAWAIPAAAKCLPW
jgi:hypothetical protein